MILRKRLATFKDKEARPAEEFFSEFFAENDIDF